MATFTGDMNFFVVICFILLTGCKDVSSASLPLLKQPEQIHLSYGGSCDEMIVTWVTQEPTSATVVEYGQMSLDFATKGDQWEFVDSGPEKRAIYIHNVTLADLVPGQRYWYHCGGPDGWSDLFFFTAMKDGNKWSPRFALYGDLGNENAKSLTRLQEETQRNYYDAIFHVGDFAYDMPTDNGRVGDAFMRQIQPVAAYVPYMTSVGNHESYYNFSHYTNRFRMPGRGLSSGSLYYSVDVGPVHFVLFSSEMYYYLQFGWKQIEAQYNWLLKDLQEANTPENRAKRPWIITMCHRPMYCTNSNDAHHCNNINNIIRVGFPVKDQFYFGIEELLYKYGVDIHIQAHEHSYERMWPVYNRTVCNGSRDEPYKNPQAPVHIVTGSAGCHSGHDPFTKADLPWTAFRSEDYGYMRMYVYNSTHTFLEQVSDDKDGAVIDKITVIKENHGAGSYNCH